MATPTPSPEPLVPTPREDLSGLTAAKTPVPVLLPTVPSQGRERIGVGVPGASGPITSYPVAWLGIGWYLDWGVRVEPPRPGGIPFWQMVRVSEEGYRPDEATVRSAAAANRGAVWLIGNEPDVVWQDNVTPERYAELYGELYGLLKSADPRCQVAIGGVSQPTPLRMAYLDHVLAAYEAQWGRPMSVDIWNVHAFLLREEQGSWGVGIPPGSEEQVGVLYEIDDHDNIKAFEQRIRAFRRWMAVHGQQSRPLAVSEYGILMPADYGFDEARVEAFMYATFDFFATARDSEVGYPADDYRLVQWWAWYSLADSVYPTGNLADPKSRALLPLGLAFARYAVAR